MATIKLNWQAPTTRESGRALNPADIALFSLEHSVDGGEFSKLPDIPAGATSRDVPDMGPGVHAFRLSCVDTRNKTGQAATGSIEVPDDTPPGVVLNLTLSIASGLATNAG